MSQPERYLIECRDSTGDLKLWWMPSNSGYTVDVAKAGRYTKEESEEIARQERGLVKAWPESRVLEIASLVVGINQV